MVRRVFEVLNRAHWHQFQVLTKRPERAARYASRLRWGTKIWIGTSIESMEVAHRADAIRTIRDATVRFISAEPLLGPLEDLRLTGIDWVIGGGESGAGHRACDPQWARGLRDLCERERVPFFWKQWGGRTSKSGGRLLDGVEHNGYPIPL